MTLSHNAAILSSLSYDADEQPDGSTHGIVLEDAHYYVSENSPDKAIVANVDGYCYFAFAGSEADVSDWMQNFDPRTEPVYDDDGNSCDAREGFVRAYNAPFKEEAEGALRGCAATCDNPEECVVLTGHSQGGSIANLAAIRFHDLSPYVITFGQAGSVHEPCPQINSEKYYRYINSILDGDELEHDPVPFAPMVGSSFQGYMIIVSPMSDAVASYGLDADVDMTNFHINVFPFQAHRLDEGDYGYLQRMDAIMSHNHYPVPSDGWKIGEPCSDEGECISGRCDNNVCENAMGTCEPCDEDSDFFQENAVRASVLEWIFWLTMVVTVCGTVIAFQDVARDIWTGAVSLKRRTVSVAMKTQTVFQAVVIGGSGAVMVTWMKPFHLFSLHTRTQEGNALI
eukprot:CAMPEP_0185738276 /NCGR_PEP_ID=MMETSP1171-20130828/32447_1 /TAXON_ID=374046 /ORGANISM="Helicotheca tamensis, Strain CCMP826" /LENGTH=397 /DNA_ID=CAMNT_0028409443 /DNA_START=207 /DNA_END=1401 /DNA_ORIENTATION=+